MRIWRWASNKYSQSDRRQDRARRLSFSVIEASFVCCQVLFFLCRVCSRYILRRVVGGDAVKRERRCGCLCRRCAPPWREEVISGIRRQSIAFLVLLPHYAASFSPSSCLVHPCYLPDAILPSPQQGRLIKKKKERKREWTRDTHIPPSTILANIWFV